MRVDLDAEVRTREGEAAGSVQRAIIDPQANEVSDFVISTGGLFGYDVLVPRERLEESSREGRTIRLDLTRDELKNMPPYEPMDYAMPTSGWVPPAGYAYPLTSFLWPVGYLDPERERVVQDRGEGEGDVWPAIRKGTAVRDSSGDEIGVVDDVRVDPASGQLEGLVIRAGGVLQTFFGGGETFDISRSQIARVADGDIYLAVAKDHLERLADHD